MRIAGKLSAEIEFSPQCRGSRFAFLEKADGLQFRDEGYGEGVVYFRDVYVVCRDACRRERSSRGIRATIFRQGRSAYYMLVGMPLARTQYPHGASA